MLREFLDRLLELKRDPVTMVAGVPYWTEGGGPVAPLCPSPLKFSTLTGFVDYAIAGKVWDCQRAFFAVHILSPVAVDLISQSDAIHRHREIPACAFLNMAQPKFGEWLDQDQFSIFLQTEFFATQGRAELLRGVAVLDAEDVRTSKDDGVTQIVSARKGIVMRERQWVSNTVSLKPYRTFREVEQPSSLFLVRVRESGGRMQIAIFPSDGNSWTLEAIKNIREWLKEKLVELEIPVLG